MKNRKLEFRGIDKSSIFGTLFWLFYAGLFLWIFPAPHPWNVIYTVFVVLGLAMSWTKYHKKGNDE